MLPFLGLLGVTSRISSTAIFAFAIVYNLHGQVDTRDEDERWRKLLVLDRLAACTCTTSYLCRNLYLWLVLSVGQLVESSRLSLGQFRFVRFVGVCLQLDLELAA